VGEVDLASLVRARREAQRRIEEARREAKRIIDSARQEASKIVESVTVDPKAIEEEEFAKLSSELEAFEREIEEELRRFKEAVGARREEIVRAIVNFVLGGGEDGCEV